MDYATAVGEARKLVKRSEQDQWRLAELTWQNVKPQGTKTQGEWAADIEGNRRVVNIWYRMWERYGRDSRSNDLELPDFRETYLMVKTGAENPQEARAKEYEGQALGQLRNLPPARKREFARELLDDPEIATDPGVRARVQPSEPSPERMQQQRDLDERLSQQRKERHGLRYIHGSDIAAKIRRLSREGFNETHEVNLDDEERELLTDEIDQAIAMLNLWRVDVAGTADVNWDAELAKLGDLA